MTAKDTAGPLTDAEIADIRRRSDAATPGPWRVRCWGGTNQENPEPSEWTIDGPGGYGIEAHDVYPGDGRDVYFIAHSRQDIPRLLATIDKLQAKCANLRESAQIRGEALERAEAQLSLYDMFRTLAFRHCTACPEAGCSRDRKINEALAAVRSREENRDA